MDLVVVGNGIVALTAAFRIASRASAGDRIRVVGPAARPGSATLAAAAMLNSFAELEVGGLDSEIDRFRFELSRRAARMWTPLCEELASEAHRGLGTFVLDRGQPDFEVIVSALAAAGEPHELVSAADVPGYHPAGARVERAVFIPNEGWVDARPVLADLDRALAAFPHVQRIDACAARLHTAAGAVTGVELEDGSVLDGSDVLVANGASAGDLLARSAIASQRVFYGVGVSVELRAPGHSRCVRAPATYSVPMANGHVLVGATNLVSAVPIAQPPEGTVAALIARAAEQIDRAFDAADIVRVNVGWRPISEDSYPLIGRMALRNLIVATGTRRDGFHLAPVISEYLAALVFGDRVDPRMAVFAPERTPIESLRRLVVADPVIAAREPELDEPVTQRPKADPE